MNIKIKKLNDKAFIPTQTHKGDAGFDLYATERVVLRPFERRIVPTGISISIPMGYYGRIAPRSGLAVKKGIDVMAGVIDHSFRGEIGVVLINLAILGSELNPGLESSMFGGKNDFIIQPGDRIAQIIFTKIADEIEFEEAISFDASTRGSGGYGSTGV